MQQMTGCIEGLVTPQAKDVECAVLGALMLEQNALTKVITLLTPDCFYIPANRIIYENMIALHRDNKPVDLLSVAERVMNNETVNSNGGISYVSSLTNMVAGAANIEYMTMILLQKHVARSVIDKCNKISRQAYDDSVDIGDVVEELSNTSREISEMLCGRSNIRHVSKSVSKAMREAENRQNMSRKGITVGVDTGIHDLNVITGGGWKPGQLIVIAARPAMGKTAVLLHLAKQAALNGTPSCIYSLEMSDVSLANRLILSECDVDVDRFKTGRMSDEEFASLNRAAGVIEKLPIYVDDNPVVSMEYIRSHSKIMADKGQCRMILVDYLQLADVGKPGTNRNREQEIAQASRMAKIISKELGIPFILLSQLSRGVEARADKKPQLSDLRESGAIEQDADTVIFIYRPAYYNIETINVKSDRGVIPVSTKGIGLLCVEKQRDGATGTVKFKHNPSMTRITDYDVNIDPVNPF